MKIHFWFWLDRPVFDGRNNTLRDWAEEQQEAGMSIDPSIYNPVQPHYTAKPIFDGAEDPLGEGRSGILEGGSDVARLPECVLSGSEFRRKKKEEEKRRQKERERRKKAPRLKSRAQTTTKLQRYTDSALRNAFERVANAEEGFRNETLNEEAFGMGRFVGAGLLDEERVRDRLRNAGLTSGLREDEVERTLESGLSSGIEEAYTEEELNDRLSSSCSVGLSKTRNDGRDEDANPSEWDAERIQDYWKNSSAEETNPSEGQESTEDVPFEIEASDSGVETPGLAEKLDSLDEEAREAFEERAAWLEYCDGYSRLEAEKKAARRIFGGLSDENEDSEALKALKAAIEQLEELPDKGRETYRALAYRTRAGPGSEFGMRALIHSELGLTNEEFRKLARKIKESPSAGTDGDSKNPTQKDMTNDT